MSEYRAFGNACRNRQYSLPPFFLGLIEKSLKEVTSHLRPEESTRICRWRCWENKLSYNKELEQQSRANIQLKPKGKVKSKVLKICLIGFVSKAIGSHRKHLRGDGIIRFWQGYSGLWGKLTIVCRISKLML